MPGWAHRRPRGRLGSRRDLPCRPVQPSRAAPAPAGKSGGAGSGAPAEGPPDMSDELDQLASNTIRTLSIDAVLQTNSGHPRTPIMLDRASYASASGFARGAYILADAP